MRSFKTLGILGALAVVVTTLAVLLVGPVSADGTVNCADAPYNNTISGTVEGNVEVTEYDTICLVTGTIKGDVKVKNDSPECAVGYPPFTAINIVGGIIEGNVKSSGGPCVMVWLRDGATVKGNVIYQATGNLGFLGSDTGASVNGNVLLKDGRLWAHRGSTANHVDGNIICVDGVPNFGPGSATDWDGDGNDDGTIGGNYLEC